ncbi:MAG: hypothetical protein ACRYG8_32220, partial [Janthinobacterium lividum]
MDGNAPDPKRYDVHVEYSTPPVARVDTRSKQKNEKQDDGDDEQGDDGKDEAAPKQKMSRGKKILYAAIGLVVLAVLIVAGVLYWLNARQYASTDDAYIQAYITQVSSQVGGRVIKLGVDDF